MCGGGGQGRAQVKGWGEERKWRGRRKKGRKQKVKEKIESIKMVLARVGEQEHVQMQFVCPFHNLSIHAGQCWKCSSLKTSDNPSLLLHRIKAPSVIWFMTSRPTDTNRPTDSSFRPWHLGSEMLTANFEVCFHTTGSNYAWPWGIIDSYIWKVSFCSIPSFYRLETKTKRGLGLSKYIW